LKIVLVGTISGELGFLFISPKSFVQDTNVIVDIPITEDNSMDFIFFIFSKSIY